MIEPFCITVNTFQGGQAPQSVDLKNFLVWRGGQALGMTGVCVGSFQALGF
jgi:hypothetical protein